MSKQSERKAISKSGVIVLVACGVVFLVAQSLISAGVDLGWLGRVVNWTCGVIAILTFLDPLFWLFRHARGGRPWDA